MRNNIGAIAEEMLIRRLRTIKVQGEVIEKKERISVGKEGIQKLLIIRFKDRRIEKPVGNAEFDRAGIGDMIHFTPPIPLKSKCERCLCFCLLGGIAAGLLSVWLITFYSPDRFGIFLSLVICGIIGIAALATYGAHKDDTLLNNIEKEIDFFQTS